MIKHSAPRRVAKCANCVYARNRLVLILLEPCAVYPVIINLYEKKNQLQKNERRKKNTSKCQAPVSIDLNHLQCRLWCRIGNALNSNVMRDLRVQNSNKHVAPYNLWSNFEKIASVTILEKNSNHFVVQKYV